MVKWGVQWVASERNIYIWSSGECNGWPVRGISAYGQVGSAMGGQ